MKRAPHRLHALMSFCIASTSLFMTKTRVAAQTSSTNTTSSTLCTTEWIGDGYCDLSNDSPDCDYDGGDCCSCTCTDGTYFECGVAGFFCIDPNASCYPSCEFSEYGDGYCTAANNVLDCNYDGGDCCACACQDSTYECGVNGYDCQDPSPGCTTSTTSTTPTTSTTSTTPTTSTSSSGPAPQPATSPTTSSSCNPDWIGDGFCDDQNNSDDCDYDGGDCCWCTCTDGSDYQCGKKEYDCQDPLAGCTTSSLPSSPTPQPTLSPMIMPPTSDGDGESMSAAMIGGIAAGGILAIGAIVACVYFLRKSRSIEPTGPKPTIAQGNDVPHVQHVQHVQRVKHVQRVQHVQHVLQVPHVPHVPHVEYVQDASVPSAPPVPEEFTDKPPEPAPSYDILFGGQGNVH